MPLHRKYTRLASKNYIGKGAYFFTICCARRLPHLADSFIAHAVLQILLDTASSRSFTIHAYCLMPDHIHILVGGASMTSDALEFGRLFKLRTGFHFKKLAHQTLWECSDHDHVLRNGDPLIEVARYIWWNPVRRKLCNQPDEYPFSGSQTMPWMQQARTPSYWPTPWKLPV
jgi:putative transposase